MTRAKTVDSPRRNKGFDATHRALIEVTVRLISEKGVEAAVQAYVAETSATGRQS